MSYTSLDITINNQSLKTDLINSTTGVNPIELNLLPANVIQKGE
jgi:hypothetical protein